MLYIRYTSNISVLNLMNNEYTKGSQEDDETKEL